MAARFIFQQKNVVAVDVMPRYLFETDDGTHHAEGDALDLDGPDDARMAVLASLPDMARDVMPDGDRRIMRATATDEAGRVVYSATLTLVGLWGAVAS